MGSVFLFSELVTEIMVSKSVMLADINFLTYFLDLINLLRSRILHVAKQSIISLTY